MVLVQWFRIGIESISDSVTLTQFSQNENIEFNTPGYYLYNPSKSEAISGSDKISNQEIYASVPVTKIWNDEDNQDGKRPSQVLVNLYADGEYVKTVKVKASEGWSYTFKKLPIYNDQNERIVYTITEDEVPEYTTNIENYTITNTYKVEKIDISGTKTWNDNNNQDGKRPTKTKIYLMADGTKVQEAEITAQDNWKYSFKNLNKLKNGTEIKYTISEEAIPEYEISYDGYNVTNTYTPKVINVSGAKFWDDEGNQDGIRPEKVKIDLYADGELINSTETNEEKNWLYEFKNLPKYKDGGKEIVYTVDEAVVEGYTNKKIEGYNITNTHVPEKITISGKKIWNDNNNEKGKRPEKVVVNLFDGKTKVASVEVTAETEWKYTFENLPKYKNKGEEIKYTVIEEEIENYTSEVNGFDITNTYTEEEPEPEPEPKQEEKKADPVQTGDVIIKIVVGILVIAIVGLLLSRIEIRRAK